MVGGVLGVSSSPFQSARPLIDGLDPCHGGRRRPCLVGAVITLGPLPLVAGRGRLAMTALRVLAAQAARRYSWRSPPRRSRRSTGPMGKVGRWPGEALVEPLMGASPVVVVEELRQHALQVPAAEDQEVVQALAPSCAAK